MSYMMLFFSSNGSYQQEELALQIALLLIVDSNRGSLSPSLSWAGALCSVIKARLENSTWTWVLCCWNRRGARIHTAQGWVGSLLALVICWMTLFIPASCDWSSNGNAGKSWRVVLLFIQYNPTSCSGCVMNDLVCITVSRSSNFTAIKQFGDHNDSLQWCGECWWLSCSVER